MRDKLPLLKAASRKFELEGATREENGHSLLRTVAEACPMNLTGADVATLCADAYGIAQRERIVVLDDVAEKLAVSIGTLLNFLELLESAEMLVASTGEQQA